MTILVTGAAGFIGFHLCKRLIETGKPVIGIDNLNDYYDPDLKRDRISLLKQLSEARGTEFTLIKIDLQDNTALSEAFLAAKPKQVVNLAAQAGVRYSITNPHSYIQSNLVGFSNILESCRAHNINHLIYASSSSVYGGNTSLPFSERLSVDHPVSLYAATKKANELMAHSYSHLYDLPTTGLRFFTVYGPWGRPDMALFLFTRAILSGEPIQIFNNGQMTRDFTYIDDIIESIVRILDKPPGHNDVFDTNNPDPSSSWAPYKVFNIGNNQPVPLMSYIEAIESKLGIIGQKQFLPMQQGDVARTASDVRLLEEWINFRPTTSISEGISKFVDWYRGYYNC